ncbi:MAG: hypothetical protein HOE90_04800 [Bacteriovoracaceae bacterium]|nr:hypothetical protein [Bacteriovoracaceae bacterium]
MNKSSTSFLLPIFSFLGVVLALASALKSRLDSRENYAAKVGESFITSEQLNKKLSLLSLSNKNQLNSEIRSLALEKLIEEELLIQKALELKIFRNDPIIRNKLVSSVIESVAGHEMARLPKEEDLKSFYQGHPELFSSDMFIKLSAIHFPIKTTREATLASAADFIESAKKSGDFFESAKKNRQVVSSYLPLALLPLTKVRQYIGADLVEVAKSLEEGQISAPIVLGNKVYLLYLSEKRAGKPLAYDRVKENIVFSYNKNRIDQSLKDYLARLKQRGQITRNVF